MATLYVTEGRFAMLSLQAQVMGMPALVTGNNVAIGGASALSAAFGTNTQVIRIEADATCSVKIGGVAPVATAADMRIAAGVPEYFAVNPGDKLAVITNT